MGFFTTLALAGATAYSAYSQGQAAKAEAEGQSSQMRHNAAMEERNAETTKEKGIFDGIQQALQGDRNESTIRAKLGHANVSLTDPNSLRILATQFHQDEIQNDLIGYNSQVEQAGHKSAAANYRSGAAYSDARAKNASKAGTLAAATSLLGNVGTMYDKGMFTSKSGSSGAPLKGGTIYSGGSEGSSLYPKKPNMKLSSSSYSAYT